MDPLSGYGRGGGCIEVNDPFAFPFHLPERAGTSTWRHFDETRRQVKQVSALTKVSDTRSCSTAVCPAHVAKPEDHGAGTKTEPVMLTVVLVARLRS